MSLVCLLSAHGSPGVTTTALCLAAVWPADGEVLLVETDRFGGMLAARAGLADTPGLVSLASESRGRLDRGMVWRHTQTLPGGLPILVGPPGAEPATAVLGDLAGPLADWAASTDVAVVADCGRMGPGLAHLPLLAATDQVLVVCHPTADQLRPAAARLRALLEAGVASSLLLVGDTPYGPSEVASTLDVPVAGVVAFDPSAATVLANEGGSWSVRRSRLVRSTATLAADLAVRGQHDSSVGEEEL